MAPSTLGGLKSDEYLKLNSHGKVSHIVYRSCHAPGYMALYTTPYMLMTIYKQKRFSLKLRDLWHQELHYWNHKYSIQVNPLRAGGQDER